MKSKLIHDPGGKVRLALPDGTISTAVFGGARDEYRYTLSRTWDESKRCAMFVMMNPSTADLTADDPSVAKCGRYARAWGYGGLLVGNTFAYRATDKKRLLEVTDPVGPDNDKHLIEMAKRAAIVVFAYGQPGHPTLRGRGPELARLLIAAAKVQPHVLRLAKDGTPYHPLYLKETLMPFAWTVS